MQKFMLKFFLFTGVIDSIDIRYSTDDQSLYINFQSLEDNPFDYDYYYYYEVNRGREDVDCFADKLVFTDGINTFSPIYSGYCSSYSSQQVIVQLDSRDYLSFIQLGFATASDGIYPALSIYTNSKALEGNFTIEPITAENPINATYTVSSDNIGYDDIEYFVEDGILVFHFNTFIRFSSLNISVLEMSSALTRNENNTRRLTVSETIILTEPVDDLAITIAIRIGASDKAFLEDKYICTNRTNCVISWTPDLATSFNGHSVHDNQYGIDIYRVWPVIQGKRLLQ